MLVKKIYYPLKTLGPGNRIGIWTSGCNKRCPGCISKELQVRDETLFRSVEDLIHEIKKYYENDPSLSITITGGEPFLQEDLPNLVIELRKLGIEDILVYSGYTYEELRALNKPSIETILTNIGVLIDGEYVEELNDNKALRGSSNQRIIFFKDSLIEKYKPCLNRKREFEVVYDDNKYDFYGIFNKGMESSIKETFKRYQGEFISSNDLS